jgi:hypothetical protein
MSSRLRTCLLTVAFALISSAHVSAAGAQEKRLAADERQIVDRDFLCSAGNMVGRSVL